MLPKKDSVPPLNRMLLCRVSLCSKPSDFDNEPDFSTTSFPSPFSKFLWSQHFSIRVLSILAVTAHLLLTAVTVFFFHRFLLAFCLYEPNIFWFLFIIASLSSLTFDFVGG